MGTKNELQSSLARKKRVIHYHLNDLAALAQLFKKERLGVFLIDKKKYPKAFKETSLKFVVSGDLASLKDILTKNGLYWVPSARNDTLGFLELIGPRRQSRVYVDALGSLGPSVIRNEISRAMGEGWAFLLLPALKDSGLLKCAIPELQDCVGLEGGSHHNESVFNHLIGSLEAAKDYHIKLQWAVLLHDIGKPATVQTVKNEKGKVDVSFHSHEVVGAKIVYNLCKRLGFRQADIRYIVLMVRHHMFYFPESTTDKAIKKWLFKIGKNNWKDLFLLRIADRKGNKTNKYKPTITLAMKKLEEKVYSLMENETAIFREDLAISEKKIKSIVSNPSDLKESYPRIIGIVNTDPEKNTEEWLVSYLERIYGNKRNQD